jgi:hypothetical protein
MRLIIILLCILNFTCVSTQIVTIPTYKLDKFKANMAKTAKITKLDTVNYSGYNKFFIRILYEQK